MNQPIEWKGDLDDDCTAEHGDLFAHVECMGAGWYTSEDPDTGKPDRKDRFKTQTWWCSVSIGRGKDSVDLFNSGDCGGAFSTGGLARAVCEAIMRGRP